MIVLVTGGASGIGRAAALAFSQAGATHVVVADRDAAGAETVVAALTGPGSSWEIDVTDEAQVAEMIDVIVEDHGRIDAAFNNAGISDSMHAFHELELTQWQRMIDINLTSVFLCMKHELRHMSAQGHGAIVNTSSGAGIVAAPGQPHYTAAKHGVIGLTKTAAQEYGRHGIRANAVLPGSTDTPMIRSFIGDNPDIAKLIARSNFQGELIEPSDIADVAVWLASDGARMVNGQALIVDGGGIVR